MRNRSLALGLIVIAGLSFLAGCGKGSVTAPSGSTITTDPSSVTMTIAGDTIVNLKAVVKGQDGKPMPSSQLIISGPFAAPRTPTRYQFYKKTNGNEPVDSGFTADTDGFGIYLFSIKIPATLDDSSNTFNDNISIWAGDASATITLSITGT